MKSDYISSMQDQLSDMEDKLESAKEEIELLEKIAEFYGDYNNWEAKEGLLIIKEIFVGSNARDGLSKLKKLRSK